MTELPSYGKIPQWGTKDWPSDTLEKFEVEIEEKLDGSQFSFGKDRDGVLRARSRKTHFEVTPRLIAATPSTSMFYGALKTVLGLKEELPFGWTFRGEVLKGPRHNVLTYESTPPGNIVLFDIFIGYRTGAVKHFETHDVLTWAKRLGLISAPLLARSHPDKPLTLERIRGLVEGPSIIGGKREGIVLKARKALRPSGSFMKCKIVGEDFREKKSSGAKGKKSKALSGTPVEIIASRLDTDARYNKAYQHVRETLDLESLDMCHIGACMKDLSVDIQAEEKEWIKEKLWDFYRGAVIKHASKRFPLWFKENLRDKAPENSDRAEAPEGGPVLVDQEQDARLVLPASGPLGVSPD